VTSRKIYRTVITRGDVLDVVLRLTGGQEFQGRLLDVNINGAAVAFSARQVRKIQPGSRGVVEFSPPGGQTRFSVDVQVQSISRMGETIRLGFRFLAEPQPKAGWSPSLRALFNRRSAFRVQPRPHEPVGVRVRADAMVGPRRSERGLLLDMSLTGMAVALDEPALEGIAPDALVRLSFRLPESEMPVMLGALVRRTIREEGDRGDRLRLGVQFRHDLGRRFLASRSELRRFVMERQREDLRNPREKRRRKTDR